MSSSNDQVSNPSIYGEVDLENAYKLTTPSGKVVVVNARRHGWRIPEVINPSLQSVVPLQDRNVYTYYEQLMALKRAAVAIVEEIAEMTDSLLPDVTAEDANKVLVVNGDGTGVEWKRSSASGVDAEVTQTDYGAHIEIVNSGYKTEADIYNGTDGAKGDPGFSPTANVQPTATGALITITDQNGTTTAGVNNGETGPKGDPGVSPTASVQRVEGGAEITVTDEFGTTTAKVNDGADGLVGRDGVDGVSPTASVTQVNPNTVRFDVTDKNGTTSATLTGEAGQDGVDGISPTATVTQTPTGATVSITDKNGTTTANLTNGSNGSNGVDGVSPSATVTQTDTGATVTITDHNGTTTANLTNGQRGSDGNDGYSPSASVTQTDSGATINITDKNGTSSATVTNGAKGDAGPGVASGGTTGQYLRKKSDSDYDTEWYTPPTPEQKEYELDYVKENGSWFTTLSDGDTVQKLPVPAEWTQGGSGVGINVLLPDYTYETVLAARNDALSKHIPAYYSDDNVWMVPIICFTIEPWAGSNGPCAWYLDMANNQFVGLCGSYGGEGKIYKTLSSTCEYEADTTYNTVRFGNFNGISTSFAPNGDDTFTFRTVDPGVYYEETTLPTKKYVDDILLPHYKFVRWDDYFGPGTVRKVGSCNLDNDEYDIFEFYYRTGALPDKTSITYPLTPTLDDYTIKTFIEASGFTNHGHMISSGRTDNSDNTVIIQQTSINNKTVTLRSYGDLSRNIAYLKFTFIGTKNTP